MASATDRPLRSIFPTPVRRWCATYAQRWRIPLDELASVVTGADIIPLASEVQARAARVSDIADLLDAFMPGELQWNFWYRPSLCQPIAPMCRLGWSSDCLEEFLGELRMLHELHSEADPVIGEQQSILKLFKPAMMFKRLEDGFAVTHVVIEHKPVRYDPLEFAPGDHAPFTIGPPLGAVDSISRHD